MNETGNTSEAGRPSDKSLHVAQPLREPVRAAYIHIPFCLRKCAYCDFASCAGQLDLIPAYVDMLLREISLTAAALKPDWRTPLDSVFFGGGTPSLLSPPDLERILVALEAAFGFSANTEISFEANPGTLNEARMHEFRQAGCNRISLGIQSLNPQLLKTLGRLHNAEEAVLSLKQAEAAGFSRISADLMFGLPGQTVADVAATVNQLLELPVNHLSFYSLSLEPGTVFYQRYHNKPELLPTEETERAQYSYLLAAASTAGMEHYEISNAACPGERCRHNLVYWRAEPYYGFGAAAHSYVGAVRRGNNSNTAAYMNCIAEAEEAFAAAVSAENISRQEQEQEFMLLGLRLVAGVSAGDFQQRFGSDLWQRFAAEIKRLTRRGLLEKSGEYLYLTRTGLDLANQVFMEFV